MFLVVAGLVELLEGGVDLLRSQLVTGPLELLNRVADPV